MKESMTVVFDMWNRYWDKSGYFGILLLACVFLLFLGRKKREGRYLVIYQFFMLAVYFCPLTAWLIQKCIGWLVYWRVLWLFPVVPLVACAFTLVVDRWKSKWLKVLCAGLLVAVIAVGGTNVWQAGNYVKVENRQKLPDEVVKIATVIEENRSSEDSLVAVDDHVASYIRVYDPSIKMPYGREGRGAVSSNARALYRTIIIPDPPVRKVTIRAKRENCEFIVFQAQNQRAVKQMERYGFELLDKAGDYGIFKKIRK